MVGFEGDGFNCTGKIGKEHCLHFLCDNYTFVIYRHAADIPECVRGLDDCDMNATCINTVGSYDCMCNTGFTGSGFTCTGMYQTLICDNYAFTVQIATLAIHLI